MKKLHTWNCAVSPHLGLHFGGCSLSCSSPATDKSHFWCGCCCWSRVLTLLLGTKGRTELGRAQPVAQLSCSSAGTFLPGWEYWIMQLDHCIGSCNNCSSCSAPAQHRPAGRKEGRKGGEFAPQLKFPWGDFSAAREEKLWWPGMSPSLGVSEPPAQVRALIQAGLFCTSNSLQAVTNSNFSLFFLFILWWLSITESPRCVC